MAKCFKRCPLQFKYKYLDELARRVLSKPLTRGKWFHSLLETYYRPDDDPANGADGEYRETWEDVPRHMSHKFSTLFDEEKEELGDLPREMQYLMASYRWTYRTSASSAGQAAEKTN